MRTDLSYRCSDVRRALCAALAVDLDLYDYPVPDYLYEPDPEGDRSPACMVFDVRDLPGSIAWFAWVDGHGWFWTLEDIGDALVAFPRVPEPLGWIPLAVGSDADPAEVASAAAAAVAARARLDDQWGKMLRARVLHNDPKTGRVLHTSEEIASIMGESVEDVNHWIAATRAR